MTSENFKLSKVQHLKVTAEQAGRRIDNYLTGHFADIPKTRIYKMLRTGEVRVNSARVKQDYRIMENDIIRVPPVYTFAKISDIYTPSAKQLDRIKNTILFEDKYLLVLNKPAGIAVHGGSKEKLGLIEILRYQYPVDTRLELVHRLDKPTSGCLLIAKDHRILREMHNLLREKKVKKYYLALLKGQLMTRREVAKPLRKNGLRSGERRVQVNKSGKQAITFFEPVSRFHYASLARIEISTGRTHQIRAHAATMGHPVAGDIKYGDRKFNYNLKHIGLKRMFLHAEKITINLPHIGHSKTFEAPLPNELKNVLNKL
jgi:23S rRNA pseudouridine955/2504/2580 synthase